MQSERHKHVNQQRFYRCTECGCTQECFGTIKACEQSLRAQQWLKSKCVWYCQLHRPFPESDKAPLFRAVWELHAECHAPCIQRYLFNLPHRHEFDYAFPEYRVAVEVDGGGFVKFGGRHMTDGDRDKLNAAAAKGWRVLRFSPQQLENDPLKCIEVVKTALEYSGVK